MPLTPEQRTELVRLLRKTPQASSFLGRTTLLGDAGDLALNRDPNNDKADLDLIVQQLETLGAYDKLQGVIENAASGVAGTQVGDGLAALLVVVRAMPPSPPPPPDPHPPWWKAAIAAGALLALGGAGGLIYFYVHGRPPPDHDDAAKTGAPESGPRPRGRVTFRRLEGSSPFDLSIDNGTTQERRQYKLVDLMVPDAEVPFDGVPGVMPVVVHDNGVDEGLTCHFPSDKPAGGHTALMLEIPRDYEQISIGTAGAHLASWSSKGMESRLCLTRGWPEVHVDVAVGTSSRPLDLPGSVPLEITVTRSEAHGAHGSIVRCPPDDHVTLAPWRVADNRARELRLDQVVLWKRGGGGDWPEWLCLPRGAKPTAVLAFGENSQQIPLRAVDPKPADTSPCTCCWKAGDPGKRWSGVESACTRQKRTLVAPEWLGKRKSTKNEDCDPVFCQ